MAIAAIAAVERTAVVVPGEGSEDDDDEGSLVAVSVAVGWQKG